MPLTPPDPDWLRQQRRAIGGRIQAARMWANLTQEQMRDLTGVDRATIQRIEAGTTDARLSWLLAISHALRIPLDQLLTGRGQD